MKREELKEGDVVKCTNTWCTYTIKKLNKTTAWLELVEGWLEMRGGKMAMYNPLTKGVRLSEIKRLVNKENQRAKTK